MLLLVGVEAVVAVAVDGGSERGEDGPRRRITARATDGRAPLLVGFVPLRAMEESLDLM